MTVKTFWLWGPTHKYKPKMKKVIFRFFIHLGMTMVLSSTKLMKTTDSKETALTLLLVKASKLASWPCCDCNPSCLQAPKCKHKCKHRRSCWPGGPTRSRYSLTQINVLSLEVLEPGCRLEMSIGVPFPAEYHRRTDVSLHLAFVSQRYAGWEAGGGV